jgi:cytochrome c biogenesis protein CcmG/thiol:disulfide interchange protein DsbE
MPRLKLFLPLAAFVLLSLLLFRGLSLDPTSLPSALVGKPLPDFELEELHSGEILSRQDIIGEPMLVNIWATWCYSCRVEHPYLLELAAQGVRIIGLNYKDDGVKAIAWLKDLGDPYALTLADSEGMLGLDMGVYGAPETYVVDANGVVQFRHVGVVDAQVWQSLLAEWFPEFQSKAVAQ